MGAPVSPEHQSLTTHCTKPSKKRQKGKSVLGTKMGKPIAQDVREIPVRAGRCSDPLNKPERKGVTLSLCVQALPGHQCVMQP